MHVISNIPHEIFLMAFVQIAGAAPGANEVQSTFDPMSSALDNAQKFFTEPLGRFNRFSKLWIRAYFHSIAAKNT
jgi:hypothetical protein